jgi:hypothetical protein
MGEPSTRERFIPLRKSDIVRCLLADPDAAGGQQDKLRALFGLIGDILHHEFHRQQETLNECYYPFNPDRDTRTIPNYPPEELQRCEATLVDTFEQVLVRSNYSEITRQDWDFAMREDFFSAAKFTVDLDAFDRILVYGRGDAVHRETVKQWGLRKQTVALPVFERLALLIKFRQDDESRPVRLRSGDIDPGTIIIKLFKNIPKADLEMLLPNARVLLRRQDLYVLSGTIGVGGISVLLKAGAGILAFLLVLYSIVSNLVAGGEIRPVTKTEMTQLVGGLSALGIIASFVWKQYTKIKNRQIKSLKILSDSLYHKNLDNNAGVFDHLIMSAEAEEFKETVLGYTFLLAAENGLTAADLDARIEEWLIEACGVAVDFEITDALAKLEAFGLCRRDEPPNGQPPVYTAVGLDAALAHLDARWDAYHTFNVASGG